MGVSRLVLCAAVLCGVVPRCLGYAAWPISAGLRLPGGGAQSGLSLRSAAAAGGRRRWLVMRDRSAVSGFREGELVEVVKDVFTRGGNAAGLVGRVDAVWEKCMVDPTCCCAELSMEEAGVKVVFNLSPNEAARFDAGRLDVAEGGGAALSTYFGEDELQPVGETATATKDQ